MVPLNESRSQRPAPGTVPMPRCHLPAGRRADPLAPPGRVGPHHARRLRVGVLQVQGQQVAGFRPAGRGDHPQEVGGVRVRAVAGMGEAVAAAHQPGRPDPQPVPREACIHEGPALGGLGEREAVAGRGDPPPVTVPCTCDTSTPGTVVTRPAPSPPRRAGCAAAAAWAPGSLPCTAADGRSAARRVAQGSAGGRRGGGGIRTHGALAGPATFKVAAFGRSATPPRGSLPTPRGPGGRGATTPAPAQRLAAG